MTNADLAKHILVPLVLIMGGGWWFFSSALNSTESGDHVLSSHFKRPPLDFSIVDIKGGGSSVFQEGLIFQKARFKSNELPAFRDPQRWRELTDDKAIESALHYLASEFPDDKDSLVAGAVVAFETTDDKPIRFAYNARTHVGCLAIGSDGTGFMDVKKQLEELNRLGNEEKR